MDPTSTYVRYERRGPRLVPVRVTKAWVRPPEARGDKVNRAATFVPVRVTELWRFPRPERAPEPWESDHRVESRERILGLGNVRPEAHGQPYLALDDRAGWWASIANRTYDWERAAFDPLTNGRIVPIKESTADDANHLGPASGPVPQE